MGSAIGSIVGGVASGLFGGGGSSSSQSTMPTPPAWLAQDWQHMVGNAVTQSANPNIVAPLSADESSAFQSLRDMSGQYQPFFNQAESNLGTVAQNAISGPSSAQIQGLMNPYLQNVLNAEKTSQYQNYNDVMNQIKGRSAMQGAFGGSGDYIQRAMANQGLQNNLNMTQAQGLSTAYNQAMNQWNTQQRLLGQTALGQAGVAGQGQNAGIGMANALATAGSTQRGINQQVLQAPQQQTQWLSDILSQADAPFVGQTSTLHQPGAGVMNSVIGGAMAGSQLGNAIGGGPSWGDIFGGNQQVGPSGSGGWSWGPVVPDTGNIIWNAKEGGLVPGYAKGGLVSALEKKLLATNGQIQGYDEGGLVEAPKETDAMSMAQAYIRGAMPWGLAQAGAGGTLGTSSSGMLHIRLPGGGLAPVRRAKGGLISYFDDGGAVDADSQDPYANLDDQTYAQMMQESGGDPDAVSSAGAAGLMQIMPATARDPGYGVKPLQGWDGKDPRTAPLAEQIRFGKDYQAAMERKFGSRAAGLAAYNAGPGNMQSILAGKMAMPSETSHYVNKLTGHPFDPTHLMGGSSRLASLLGRGPAPSAGLPGISGSGVGGLSADNNDMSLSNLLPSVSAPKDAVAATGATGGFDAGSALDKLIQSELQDRLAPKDESFFDKINTPIMAMGLSMMGAKSHNVGQALSEGMQAAQGVEQAKTQAKAENLANILKLYKMKNDLESGGDTGLNALQQQELTMKKQMAPYELQKVQNEAAKNDLEMKKLQRDMDAGPKSLKAMDENQRYDHVQKAALAHSQMMVKAYKETNGEMPPDEMVKQWEDEGWKQEEERLRTLTGHGVMLNEPTAPSAAASAPSTGVKTLNSTKDLQGMNEGDIFKVGSGPQTGKTAVRTAKAPSGYAYRISSPEERAALKEGEAYIGPDGKLRIKGQ